MPEKPEPGPVHGSVTGPAVGKDSTDLSRNTKHSTLSKVKEVIVWKSHKHAILRLCMALGSYATVRDCLGYSKASSSVLASPVCQSSSRDPETQGSASPGQLRHTLADMSVVTSPVW